MYKKFDSFLISFIWCDFSTDALECKIDEVATIFVEIPNDQITIVNSRLFGFRTCPKYDTGCNNGMGEKGHQLHQKSLKYTQNIKFHQIFQKVPTEPDGSSSFHEFSFCVGNNNNKCHYLNTGGNRYPIFDGNNWQMRYYHEKTSSNYSTNSSSSSIQVTFGLL